MTYQEAHWHLYPMGPVLQGWLGFAPQQKNERFLQNHANVRLRKRYQPLKYPTNMYNLIISIPKKLENAMFWAI